MKNTQVVDCARSITRINCFYMGTDIDRLVRENIERLLRERGLSAAELARKVDTTESYISDIRRGIRSMGTDLQNRICEALDIEPWEFYLTARTPIITNPREQEKIYRYREEEKLGIAEEIARYEDYQIDRARSGAKEADEISGASMDERIQQNIAELRRRMAKRKRKSA